MIDSHIRYIASVTSRGPYRMRHVRIPSRFVCIIPYELRRGNSLVLSHVADVPYNVSHVGYRYVAYLSHRSSHVAGTLLYEPRAISICCGSIIPFESRRTSTHCTCIIQYQSRRSSSTVAVTWHIVTLRIYHIVSITSHFVIVCVYHIV